ncbi:MAG: ankyrin repeat domain-containing protein [Candidatus Amoebophilus sp.]
MTEKDTLGHSLDKYGNTPLHDAAKKGNMEEAESLLHIGGHGVDINIKDAHGNTSLHLAIKHGHLEIAKFLIKQGVDINARNKDQNTPLHLLLEAMKR